MSAPNFLTPGAVSPPCSEATKQYSNNEPLKPDLGCTLFDAHNHDWPIRLAIPSFRRPRRAIAIALQYLTMLSDARRT
jgi:hypothetical protein